jgi:dipeptidyl aminopeptidase/acylaminoacyl peptidase
MNASGGSGKVGMRPSLPAALVLLAACGSDLPPAVATPGPTAPAPLSASVAAPAAPVDAAPTVLTDAQKRRDSAAAPRVEALLDAYENLGPVLSPDGRRVLFLSTRGGVPELYLADVAAPDAAPRKLAGGSDRVGSAVFTHDGKAVLYRQDTNADENFHVFRVSLDGAGVVDLTPGEALWRDHPLLPSRKPDRMVYSARHTREPGSMVFVQDLSGGKARLAYTEREPGLVVDVSADGATALFVRRAVGGHTLVEVDLATGKARSMYPPDGAPAVRIGTAAYAADGKRVFLSTDGGSESYSVLALDTRSLATVAAYRQVSPPSAAVGAVVPSPRGDRVAILVDAGNHTLVRVLDARTLAVKFELGTPLGTASLGTMTEVFVPTGRGAFSDDGTHFVIGVSSPDAPGDVYRVDTATGEIQPLRHDRRPGLESLAAVTTSIVDVAAFDGLTIPVNLYLPTSLAPSKKLPTIVRFHGGPDGSESLEWSPWTRVFLSAGFAVVEPNIRGSTGFGAAYEKADDREKRVDAMRDVESVNAWARRQSWCDTGHLIIEGGSYGGYVVLMGLTRQPKLWSAGVDLAGISDLTAMVRYSMEAGQVRAEHEFGDPEKDAQVLLDLSPIRDADKIVAPLFVYQGQTDTHVPRSQADTIVRALRERHVPVEYMVAANEGHSVDHRENKVAFLTRVLRFLHDELGLGE